MQRATIHFKKFFVVSLFVAAAAAAPVEIAGTLRNINGTFLSGTITVFPTRPANDRHRSPSRFNRRFPHRKRRYGRNCGLCRGSRSSSSREIDPARRHGNFPAQLRVSLGPGRPRTSGQHRRRRRAGRRCAGALPRTRQTRPARLVRSRCPHRRRTAACNSATSASMSPSTLMSTPLITWRQLRSG